MRRVNFRGRRHARRSWTRGGFGRVAVLNEPPFPLDLCGADYPLGVLNADWRAHLAARESELVALWREGEDPST